MENTLVSARVPKAKKDKAMSLLRERGETMSDLINAAIDALISEETPMPDDDSDLRSRNKAFESFRARTTLDIDWPSDAPGDYKSLEQYWRVHDYESLA